MRLLPILALLIGCAPYWTKANAALPLCVPVQYVDKPFLCGAALALGCTSRFPDCAISVIVLGTHEQTACRERHEQAHRDGWTHDERNTYREDCGP